MPPRPSAAESSGKPVITCRPITPQDFPLIEELFGEKGACAGCWCMWWRSPERGTAYKALQGEGNRLAFRALVQSGQAQGILAFDGATPIGWCTYGPKSDFPRLGRTKAYQREEAGEVWSIPCFFIHRGYRNQGVARGLLAAALKAIGRRKRVIIEGYPVPLTKAGERLPATFAFTGPLQLFESAGFQVVQRTSHSRPLVQKDA